ncbi:MAG: NAD(P)(+) transhydrogenase (Re/Si-specific) subunit alpha, partial [Phycisphaerales bacterium]
MVLGILRETAFGERRVATTPPAVERLRKIGVEVLVEAGAGSAAGFDDDAHRSAGAAVLSRSEILDRADTLAMVRVPSDVRVPIAELDACCTAGRTVIGLAEPFGDPERLEAVAARGTNVLALELLPRITRAQSMDVLSSQATIAGHKAVLLAAVELDRMLPMLMTAAGTLVASRVLVIGAGVAGL